VFTDVTCGQEPDMSENTQDGAPPPSTPAAAPGPVVLPVVVFGFLLYGVVGLLIAAWFGNVWARERLAEASAVFSQYPWLTVGALALIVLLATLSRYLQRWVQALPAETRRTLTGFFAVGLILLGTTAIVFLSVAHQLFAQQIALFLVASLLPGALYYLFLRTRRPSILNEFTTNLWRLGLLVRRHTFVRRGGMRVDRVETEDDVVARVDSYYQKFEAVYGALRFETTTDDDITYSRMAYVEALLEDPDAGRRRLVQPTVRLADILTANIFIPVGIATFLAALGWLLVLEPRWAGIAGTSAAAADQVQRLAPVATPLNFALLGAYFFGLQALFRRFVRRDLGPNAYLAFSNRILLSVIGVWVLGVCVAVVWSPDSVTATAAHDSTLLMLAFVIGVFPRTLWQVITAALTKLTSFVVPSMEAKQPLEDLDGLTIWHQSRLEEEDIENVPNMATADIVDLLIHTQIPAERLVDWIDQAILYKALGPESERDFAKTRRGKLREHGIRTATQLVRSYCCGDVADINALERKLGSGEGSGVARSIAQSIQIEANWDLVAAWRDVERPPADRAGGPGPPLPALQFLGT
jgi:hypothetical protein